MKHTEDGAVETDSIEVAGVLIDKFTGQKWAVPADNVEDLGDFDVSNPLKFPEERHDRKHFYYQWINKAEWPQYKALRFVRVTLAEMGLDQEENLAALRNEYGTPLTSYVEFADAMYVKCPLFIADAMNKENERRRKLAIAGTEPRVGIIKAAGRGSVVLNEQRVTTVEELKE